MNAAMPVLLHPKAPQGASPKEKSPRPTPQNTALTARPDHLTVCALPTFAAPLTPNSDKLATPQEVGNKSSTSMLAAIYLGDESETSSAGAAKPKRFGANKAKQAELAAKKAAEKAQQRYILNLQLTRLHGATISIQRWFRESKERRERRNFLRIRRRRRCLLNLHLSIWILRWLARKHRERQAFVDALLREKTAQRCAVAMQRAVRLWMGSLRAKRRSAAETKRQLECFDAQRRLYAAIHIQAAWRGYCARKAVGPVHDNTRRRRLKWIVDCARQHTCMVFARERQAEIFMAHYAAARRIQGVVRGFLCRRDHAIAMADMRLRLHKRRRPSFPPM